MLPHTIRLPRIASRRVGLLAGWGRFPVLFAEAARAQGLTVCGVGIDGMFSPELPNLCQEFTSTPVARLGRPIRFFKRLQVESVVMAGKVDKRVLFDPLRLFKLLPDWRAMHMWFRYARQNKSDDTLLLAVIREFERDGLKFASALDFCPELLVKHGFLTSRQPSPSQWKDIHFGWEIAKQMGGLDIGQTIIINDTAVIAVEAIEGTDECIRRAGLLCRRGDLTIIKVAKPQQDRRFDVPTIGLQTIQTMHEAGGRCLAIEAGQTILLDEPEVLALANKLGIAIVSLHADEVRLRIAS
ncbi:MAG: LpxI family protein [Planctomycetaceae bacterium]